MENPTYDESVFINCPFDKQYTQIFNAIVFTIIDCGFSPRCAREENDSGVIRITKLYRLIQQSKLGIHDISRNELPRFNMPFELGIFLGATEYGEPNQKLKRCLVLDKKQHNFRKYLSDISGQDIGSHKDTPIGAIREIRDWLNDVRATSPLPGYRSIYSRYNAFKSDLPRICKIRKLNHKKLTYRDYVWFVASWLEANAP